MACGNPPLSEIWPTKKGWGCGMRGLSGSGSSSCKETVRLPWWEHGSQAVENRER